MITKAVFAGIIGSIAVGSANAQLYEPLKPPAAGKKDLGWELEERFNTYMSACGVIVPLKMKKISLVGGNAKTVSSIDSILIKEMKLDAGHPIEQPLGVGLGRFFGYIYPDTEKSNPQWINSNFLSIRYDDDKDFINAFGFPVKRYSASCGSVIGTALKADGEYNFPVATLKAAFEAEYKTETRSSIELSSGRFDSPIWEMWKPAANGDAQRSKRKFFVAMLFWDWYTSVQPTGGYSLLVNFTGTSFHRQMTSNSQFQTSMSAAANSSIPFLTASGKVNASLDSGRKLEVQDFEVFVNAQSANGALVRQWKPMPSLDEVLAALKDSANVSAPKLANSSPITSNQTRSFTVDIDGLPSAYCDTPSWDARDNAAAAAPSAALSIDSAARVADSTVCRFGLSYSVGAIHTGGDVVLTPVLTSKAAVQSKRVILPLKRLSLATTTNPSMTLLLGDPRAKVSRVAGTDPAQFDLVWTVDLRLIDDGKFGDVARIDTSQLGLKCPANVLTLGDAQFEPSIVGIASGGSRTIRLTGRAKFMGGEIDAKYAFESCTLAGSIYFKSSEGGPSLERPVPTNITLYYPVRPAAP